jgi:UDP-N-acetylglucosamine diphosphorylase / glucose-1-phosphate thymidylyltransferase / UDP-N-acetylgalactosamine diphosphorylase / glucosamine-1-phosphate N-acetyltransferase / galactosamine-1-phosphate N-acetyltransferase
MIGDHAKTGIGTILTTGCVVGAGANIYGTRTTPKYIRPFAWGDSEPYEQYHSDKFITVAERMMARRHVELSEKERRQLEAVCRKYGEAK